jgi:hypothetical protein
MHSTAEAWLAERPARGLCRRAVGSGIRPAQCQQGQTQAGIGDGMPLCITVDATAQVVGKNVAILVARGCDGWLARRWQFGWCCHAGGAEEGNWGKRKLTGGSRLSVIEARAR